MKASDIVIEQEPGSVKILDLPGYPLKEIRYPTSYGSHPSYVGQDGDDLDFFVGGGHFHGHFQVHRPDVPGGIETKFFHSLTPQEIVAVSRVFKPVRVKNSFKLVRDAELDLAMEPYRRR